MDITKQMQIAHQTVRGQMQAEAPISVWHFMPTEARTAMVFHEWARNICQYGTPTKDQMIDAMNSAADIFVRT